MACIRFLALDITTPSDCLEDELVTISEISTKRVNHKVDGTVSETQMSSSEENPIWYANKRFQETEKTKWRPHEKKEYHDKSQDFDKFCICCFDSKCCCRTTGRWTTG